MPAPAHTLDACARARAPSTRSYQTGGPQRYTGRDMKTSHPHPGISPQEWAKFVEIAADTLAEAKVPAGASKELLEIIHRSRRRAAKPSTYGRDAHGRRPARGAHTARRRPPCPAP